MKKEQLDRIIGRLGNADCALFLLGTMDTEELRRRVRLIIETWTTLVDVDNMADRE